MFILAAILVAVTISLAYSYGAEVLERIDADNE